MLDFTLYLGNGLSITFLANNKILILFNKLYKQIMETAFVLMICILIIYFALKRIFLSHFEYLIKFREIICTIELNLLLFLVILSFVNMQMCNEEVIKVRGNKIYYMTWCYDNCNLLHAPQFCLYTYIKAYLNRMQSMRVNCVICKIIDTHSLNQRMAICKKVYFHNVLLAILLKITYYVY